jgi:hypothetical protein
VNLRSSLWDLEDRLFDWLDHRYPRYRWIQNHLFERHRGYVILLFGEKEPDGLGLTPTPGRDTPWFMAVCKGCRWESRHADQDAALAAARDHSPRVRPDVLSAVESPT